MAEYMKLITELNESVTTLCEAKEDGKKQWFIEGNPRVASQHVHPKVRQRQPRRR
jgi:hypothetical protein